ncbi:MAG: DUF2232 domain-containing protein [Rhodobacteraceae bacterium]|nr:DUF2232 domain-containing protein [Paracoccaceae bacterium]
MTSPRAKAIAIAAGVFGATLLVAAWRGSIFGIVFGTLLSPLPAAMAVLSFGTAALPFVIAGGVAATTLLTGTFALAVVYLLLDAAPVALLVWLSLRPGKASGVGTSAIGKALAWLTLAALALVVAGLAAMPVSDGSVAVTVRQWLGDFVAAAVNGQGATGLQLPPQRAAALDAMASFLPGAMGWNWCLRGVVSVVLAQAAIERLGNAAVPTPNYRTVAVPGWLRAGFWAIAVVGWLATGDVQYVAMNAAAVMCFPLLLQGLAVVHCGVARLDYAGMWLVAFYVLSLLMSALAFVVLVSLGVVDHFLKLRARMVPPPQGG